MGAPEVEAFLTHLAVDRSVAASTQNQVLAAKLLSSKEKRQDDSVTMLPHRLVEPFQIQLASARALHESDLRKRFGRVYLPFALARNANAGPRAGLINLLSAESGSHPSLSG